MSCLKPKILARPLLIVLLAGGILTSCSHLQARLVATRLEPGENLKSALSKMVLEKKLSSAAIVSGVGSLNFVDIRMADQKSATRIQGPLEIISLTGTISSDGSCHIHIGVSDTKGKTVGGHLSDSSSIYTTVEAVLITDPNLVFSRELDSKTGYRELKVGQTHE